MSDSPYNLHEIGWRSDSIFPTQKSSVYTYYNIRSMLLLPPISCPIPHLFYCHRFPEMLTYPKMKYCPQFRFLCEIGSDWCRTGNQTENRIAIRFAFKSNKESVAKTQKRPLTKISFCRKGFFDCIISSGGTNMYGICSWSSDSRHLQMSEPSGWQNPLSS
jgi:hypothetical protein